jgi:hypothetical protein
MVALTRDLPRVLPASTARLRPALTRWRIMLRSNSAKASGGNSGLNRPGFRLLNDAAGDDAKARAYQTY